MSVSDVYFDELYQAHPDPWGFRERWYERRKRELILASLPKPRYRRIFEPGCSNAELSYFLALRTEQLCCCDLSSHALEAARHKTAGMQHVEIVQARLPGQWPAGSFDLIVLSELGYYLDRADLLKLIEKIRSSLTADGELLACHWRPPIEGCPHNGNEVHELLHRHLDIPAIVRHEEPSFTLELWAADPRCVAEREGLWRNPAC